MIRVAESTENDVADPEPNRTAVAFETPVPVIVTNVPRGPTAGSTPVTAGRALAMTLALSVNINNAISGMQLACSWRAAGVHLDIFSKPATCRLE
jgi:hypothetical protein